MNKKIGLIFDFDDTLCPDSTNGFLNYINIDTEKFWNETKKLINEGFDPVLSYMNLMIKKSKEKEFKNLITASNFQEYGKKIKFFPGVKTFFKRIKTYVKTIDKTASVHFYLISSGIDLIINSSSVAKEFDGIFSSAFFHDEITGRIKLPKRALSFTDKTRYLFAISKGLTPLTYFSNPFAVNEKQSSDNYSIPFNKMIFTGDGFTDIPCFALLKAYKGHGIAVYNKNHIKTAVSLYKDKRVKGIAKVDYSKNSIFMQTLKKYITKILT